MLYVALGLDRLRPQHFKELISQSTGQAGVCLLKPLVNYMVLGKFHPVFNHSFWGKSFNFTDGFCPIAVGSVFHRLAAKTACLCLGCGLGLFFCPAQLGVGTPGGC